MIGGHVFKKTEMRMIVEAGREAVGGLGDVLGTYYPSSSSCLIPCSTLAIPQQGAITA